MAQNLTCSESINACILPKTITGEFVYVLLAEKFCMEPYARPICFSLSHQKAQMFMETIAVREHRGNWNRETMGDPFFLLGCGQDLPAESFITWMDAPMLQSVYDENSIIGGIPIAGIIAVSSEDNDDDSSVEGLVDDVMMETSSDEDDEVLENAEEKPADKKTQDGEAAIVDEDVPKKKTTPATESSTKAVEEPDHQHDENMILKDKDGNPLSIESMQMTDCFTMRMPSGAKTLMSPTFANRSVIARYLIVRVDPTPYESMEAVTLGDIALTNAINNGTQIDPQNYLQAAFSNGDHAAIIQEDAADKYEAAGNLSLSGGGMSSSTVQPMPNTSL